MFADPYTFTRLTSQACKPADVLEAEIVPPVDMSFQPIASFSPKLVDETWAFMNTFLSFPRQDFEETIKPYSEAVIFRNARGREIVGFGCLKEVLVTVEGRKNICIFSSLVAIDENYRGRNLGQRAGLQSFLRARLRHPTTPIYWLFCTRSYRSYLVLSRNFAEHWPRPDRDIPPAQNALLDATFRQVYGDLWDAEKGVVRDYTPRWREGALEPNERALRDPAARYFFSRVPLAPEPEMALLACMCPLSLRNWASVGLRAGQRAARSGFGWLSRS
jgi:hypothetical protein